MIKITYSGLDQCHYFWQETNKEWSKLLRLDDCSIPNEHFDLLVKHTKEINNQEAALGAVYIEDNDEVRELIEKIKQKVS